MKRINGIIVFLLLLSVPWESKKIYTQGLSDGDVLVSFEIAKDPGTLEYGIPRSMTQGIAFDGEHICALVWVIEGETYRNATHSFEIRKFDPITGTLVSSLEIFKGIQVEPLGIPHLEWDGSNFWVSSDWGNSDTRGIFKIASDTGELLQQFSISFVDSSPGALAYDGENMWVAGLAMGGWLYLVNATDGSEIAAVIPPTTSVHGLAFNGHFLWISEDNRIYKTDPETGSVISSFAAPNYEFAGALTFDGEYLWVLTSSGYVKDEETGIDMIKRSLHRVYIDRMGPSISLSSHQEGEVVVGIPRFIFNIEDPAGIAKVELRVEGVHSSWIDITSNYDVEHGYYFDWDTTIVINETYVISIQATDERGNSALNSFQLTVNNPFTPETPMVFTMTVTETLEVTTTITESQEAVFVPGFVAIPTLLGLLIMSFVFGSQRRGK